MQTNKGQGTIEYLVIIAIVIVIALVVVGLLLQIMGQGSGVPETAARAAWKSEQPWAITDWSKTSTTLTVVLKNNSSETMDFIDVYTTAADNNATVTSNVAPGATLTKTITTAASCTTGAKYSYPKANIRIDYSSSTIASKKQYANTDLVGTCS